MLFLKKRMGYQIKINTDIVVRTHSEKQDTVLSRYRCRACLWVQQQISPNILHMTLNTCHLHEMHNQQVLINSLERNKDCNNSKTKGKEKVHHHV